MKEKNHRKLIDFFVPIVYDKIANYRILLSDLADSLRHFSVLL